MFFFLGRWDLIVPAFGSWRTSTQCLRVFKRGQKTLFFFISISRSD
jgi:hypothetical protein